jgi:Tol biopolymer transport system component
LSEQREILALLREGVDEARLGNRESARALLEKVVALDPQNEKGWLWLASVSESEQEQRAYLQRVLALNPENESAKRALAKIEARAKEFEREDEVMPGVSRKQFRTILLIGAVALVVVLVAVVLIALTRNSTSQETAASVELTHVVASVTAAEVARLDEAATATQAALSAPTETPTPTVLARTAVPTWTPTNTATPFNGGAVILPTPAGLQGSIAGWSGRDIQNIDYLPVGAFNLVDGRFVAAGTSLGRDVRLQLNGQRIVYTRYDQVLFGTLIEAINLNGTQPESISARWERFGGVLEAEMPAFSPDGTRVAFIAVPQDGQVPQLYIVNLAEMPPDINPLRRLTNDGATYSYPAISPDGSRIAVVKNDTSGPTPGADIVIIDIETLSQTALTSDLGTFTESSPRWSPDGQQIVYAAAAANDPNNNEIAIRASAGFGLPTLPVRSTGNDIYPVFSPDGRMLAFSSNRGGQYDIYIFDLTTQTLSQLTNTPEEDYPGGWWQPGQ